MPEGASIIGPALKLKQFKTKKRSGSDRDARVQLQQAIERRARNDRRFAESMFPETRGMTGEQARDFFAKKRAARN